MLRNYSVVIMTVGIGLFLGLTGCGTIGDDIAKGWQQAKSDIFAGGKTDTNENSAASIQQNAAPDNARQSKGRKLPDGAKEYIAAQVALKDRSYDRAIALLQQADRKKYSPAAHTLGNMYILGRGVKKSPDRAAHYWRRAGDWGHPHSQFLLAKAFANGEGVPRDPALAARWHGKAAWRGHKQAQFHWAIYRLDKEKFAADPVSALAWLRIAGDKSVKSAALVRRKLAQRLADKKQQVTSREIFYGARSQGLRQQSSPTRQPYFTRNIC